LRRNYSISSAPNDRFYRISVKRDATPGFPAGQASAWLHDHAQPGTTVQVAVPAGDFFLEQAEKPVVLVSGGVGLTPMVSMLETIAGNSPDLPTWYVHGAQNGLVHAMRDHVRTLSLGNPAIQTHTFYSEPLATDQRGRDYDDAGMISARWLARNTPIDAATYYLCGPKPFLQALVGGLARHGATAGQVRYEFFGPADDLLDAPEQEG
jgi:nitric oxide dioxygenase